MSGHITVCPERDSISGATRAGRSGSLWVGQVNGPYDRCSPALPDDQSGLVMGDSVTMAGIGAE